MDIDTSKAMSNRDSIISWIHSLPAHAGSPPKKSRKRMTSTPKRRFDSADDAGDLDIIPRPGAGGFVFLSDTRSPIPSGASSPRQQMVNLRLRDPRVEINALNTNALPATARQLITTMEAIGHGLEILPHALESMIMKDVKARDLAHCLWELSFKSPGEADRLPGRIPTFNEVEIVCRKASECQQYSHEGASWNGQVCLRLLDSIFEGPDGQCDDFNAVSCTTARLHRAFKPVWSPNQLIDICLQIGIWHVSQCPFLQWAVAAKIRRQRIEGEAEALQAQKEQDELEAKALSILSSLEFIPSVIIQGHRWHLVLSTYEGKKTKLWADRQFGTTQTCLETYSIIAGIRRLTAWARDVYLPWFKTNVLV
ncbi:hypothetical protein F5Y07DRAFT_413572 [Xylaria sp. FL0933]|nr:hypothetical protein F5Y07DRAFT_413572 [Xylaria sp. FL0933]